MNNLIIAGEYKQDVILVKQLFKVRFKVKDPEKVWVVFSIWVKRYSQQKTLDLSPYSTMILKQFQNNMSLLNFIFINSDTIYNLTYVKKKIINKKKKLGINK